MKYAPMALLAAIVSIPTWACAQDFEALVIGNVDRNGSNFYMLSLRGDLGHGAADGIGGTGRNAVGGLRFRFDAAMTTYDTNYNNVPGTGTGRTYRALLSYGIPVSDITTLTLTGGISHRTVDVRPVTPNSPDDTSDTGEFVSVELEYSPVGAGTFQALAEHDGVAADYLSATYLFDLSSNLRLGPTVNHVSEGDYSRKAVGLSAVYFVGDQFEIKATAAGAEQQVGGNKPVDVDYFELQLRTVF